MRRLFYFTNACTARLILEGRRIRQSRFATVNDPFELMCYFSDDADHNRRLEELRVEFERFRFVSMSATWQHPVMWAHYGQKYEGVCFGVDVETNDREVHEVTYRPEPVDFMQRKFSGTPDVGFARELLNTKFDGWAYEQEWRIIGDMKPATDGEYYMDFGDDFKLREVIIGPKCTWTIDAIRKLIPDDPLVPIFKACADRRRTFNVERDQVDP